MARAALLARVTAPGCGELLTRQRWHRGSKNRSTYEEEVKQATAVSETKGEKQAMKTLSVNAGRVPSNVEVQHQALAWMNDLSSHNVSAHVTTSMVKRKADELNPNVFRTGSSAARP